jgi:hypothetical protein
MLRVNRSVSTRKVNKFSEALSPGKNPLGGKSKNKTFRSLETFQPHPSLPPPLPDAASKDFAGVGIKKMKCNVHFSLFEMESGFKEKFRFFFLQNLKLRERNLSKRKFAQQQQQQQQ